MANGIVTDVRYVGDAKLVAEAKSAANDASDKSGQSADKQMNTRSGSGGSRGRSVPSSKGKSGKLANKPKAKLKGKGK